MAKGLCLVAVLGFDVDDNIFGIVSLILVRGIGLVAQMSLQIAQHFLAGQVKGERRNQAKAQEKEEDVEADLQKHGKKHKQENDNGNFLQHGRSFVGGAGPAAWPENSAKKAQVQAYYPTGKSVWITDIQTGTVSMPRTVLKATMELAYSLSAP